MTGFTAGTLDGIGAAVVHQIHPIQLFQYVASGAIGREAAFSGGIATALLGLLFHYIIAFSWTILFFYLYPKVSLLRRNKYVVGVLYALFVWIIMNMVVVPSTLIGRGPFFLKTRSNWLGYISDDDRPTHLNHGESILQVEKNIRCHCISSRQSISLS